MTRAENNPQSQHDLEGEIWADSVDFKGFYMVSNKGRFRRSYPGNGTKTGYVQKVKLNRDGYVMVDSSIKGVTNKVSIHRQVALAFIPNPQNKRCVNHLNGDKLDNTVENLEWATDSENVQHSFDTGLQISLKGEKHPMSKLTREQAIEIRRLGKVMKGADIARKYGVYRNTIYFILKRETWRHI